MWKILSDHAKTATIGSTKKGREKALCPIDRFCPSHQLPRSPEKQDKAHRKKQGAGVAPRVKPLLRSNDVLRR